MNNNLISDMGDFTVFGFTPDPGFIEQRISRRLGIHPRVIKIGTYGQFFFYTSYGDVAESEEALVLKLGFLRSKTKSPLNAQQLLKDKIVSPGSIDTDAFSGNGLVVGLSKTEPVFSVVKTLLGVPQLYYQSKDGEIICSDRLRCIVHLSDQVEINEDIIPMHFLFRSTPGDLTYYRQIRRLLPGELMRYTEGKLSLKLAQDFRFDLDPLSANRGDEETIESVYDNLQCVVSDYLAQVEHKGERLANLLSGGVDSSLLQHMINQHSPNQNSRSYSFAVRVPSFSNEIEYAHQASQLFQTDHAFVDIQPEDYPGLITRAIAALAQPPILETEPSMLSIAEFTHGNYPPERYLVSGQGADTIFGLNWSKKLKGLHMAGQVPGAVWILKSLGSALIPFQRISQILLKGGDILSCAKDPDSFLNPTNSIVVYVDPAILRRCFGDDALKKSLRYRRELAARYLDTDHYLEKVHIIDLLTDTYELGVQRQQLFLSKEREKIHPFFDDDILRAAFAIPANKRYIKGLRPKYLLKEILQRKTGSAVSHKPKGFSIWENDLMAWMASGPLKPMVREIKLPGYLNRSDFEALQNKPTYFLWELLVLDQFRQSLN